MTNVLDLLNDAVGSAGAARQIGAQLGLDEATANQAIGAALPMLLGGLARNAADRRGAESLLGALDRDHDGSVLDDVNGFLGQGRQAADAGDGILGHVLGRRKDTAATGLGQLSGIDPGKAKMLMAMLAPLVMGALGRARRERSVDADGLGEMLQRDRARIEREPAMGGLLGKLLDQDGDGQIGDDVAKLGAGFLGRMLGGRR